MRKLIFTLICAVAMLPFSARTNAAAPSDGRITGSGASDTLKVISYNIRNGRAHDKENSWRFRKPATIDMLEDQLPDVFGVQEAFEYQVKYIAENLPDYKWYGVGRNNGRRSGEFMSVFYNSKKIRLEGKGTIWLSHTPMEPSYGWDAMFKRTATWAVMTQLESGRRFLYVNTHLDHVGKIARRKGLELITDFIEEINAEHLPVVLTGDFNVEPGDPCLEALQGKMISVRDAAEQTDDHASFNKWGKEEHTIDYIYQAGFSKMAEFKTVTKEYGGRKYISDHYPISALLVF